MHNFFKNVLLIVTNMFFISSLYSSIKPHKSDPSNFRDLIVYNAAYLQRLFREGQLQYVPELRIAEQTLREALAVQNNRMLLKECCCKYNATLVRCIASKEVKCRDLFTAIRENNIEFARVLLQDNPFAINHYMPVEYNHHDEQKITRRMTALHHAIETLQDPQRLDFAQLLLERGAKTHSIDSDGNTLAHKVNSLELLQLLQNHDMPLDQPNNDGYTPLMNSINNRCIDVANYFIASSDVNLDRQDCYGNTALHYAINSPARDWELTKALLSADADVTICNKENKTAFDYWVSCDEKWRLLIEPYIQYALLSALMNNDSQKTLDIVKLFPWMNHVIKDENPTKILDWARERCVKEGEVFKSVVDYENCLIHRLCFADCAESERLIDAGVSVLKPGYEGLTPLQWAEKQGWIEKRKLMYVALNGYDLTGQDFDPIIYD
jgi:ankyrin repeat protein